VTRAVAPWAVMGLAVVVAGLVFWPGHMNADSLSMIGQADGVYPLNDQHAPVLVWVWERLWPLGLRPGVILLLQVAAFLAGAYLIARAAFGRLGAALVGVAVAVTPPVLGFLGVIGRDTWFLVFLLLSFGFLVLAVRLPERRRLGIGAALGFALLCLFSRQNAAAAVIVVGVVVAALILEQRERSSGPVATAGLAVGLGVVAVVAGLALQFGATKAVGADLANPERILYEYDLRGLAPDDESAQSPGSAGDVSEAWFDRITGDPLGYLRFRWEEYMRQVGLTSPGIFVFHPGIDENDFGYSIAFPELNDVATEYLGSFTNSYLNSHYLHRAWFYLALALVAAVVCLRAPGPPRIVGALALSAWTYQVGIFFGGIGTQWRFEYPTAAISLISAAVAAKVLFDRFMYRREAGAERGAEGEPELRQPHPVADVPTGRGG
jgi:hypothetical protein